MIAVDTIVLVYAHRKVARIAARCIQHGVRELRSADRDFQRFPELTAVNPLVE